MGIAIVHTRAQIGVEAPLVTVETHLTEGLPSFTTVGLPEAAVRESKERVRSALLLSSFPFPDQRITVNLAPADLPKHGGRFDLAIAVSLLVAAGHLYPNQLEQYEFFGELALTGELRAVRGILPAALQCAKQKKTMIVPVSNADEAALVKSLKVLPAPNLSSIAYHLAGLRLLDPHPCPEWADLPPISDKDLSEVRGQGHAKRALEIAAAGGHSLLFLGPPGTGKTMLASRLPTILPPLTEEEALEAAAVTSISGQPLGPTQWRQRSFRSPHHTASPAALVGGGSHPQPGEVSLSHHGILFLDELPEFNRKVLEVLREPMESGRVTISRATRQAEFPAKFQFIAAMNPCPCGYLGDPDRQCHCSTKDVHQYRHRLSGPLLDRIDMHIEVPRIPYKLLGQPASAEEKSIAVRKRVIEARERQLERSSCCNAAMNNTQVEQYCLLEEPVQNFLNAAMEHLKLSIRAYHRILKVSRTCADLGKSDQITMDHISEALSYRRLDRTHTEQTVNHPQKSHFFS